MLRMFIPTSNGKISRRQYIFSFILTNLICILLISFFSQCWLSIFRFNIYHSFTLSRHQYELPTAP